MQSIQRKNPSECSTARATVAGVHQEVGVGLVSEEQFPAMYPKIVTNYNKQHNPDMLVAMSRESYMLEWGELRQFRRGL